MYVLYLDVGFNKFHWFALNIYVFFAFSVPLEAGSTSAVVEAYRAMMKKVRLKNGYCPDDFLNPGEM